MTENRFSGLKPLYSQYLPSSLFRQVGYLISPVLPEHSGQYWCVASRGGKTSDYGIMLNVLTQTR